MTDRSHDDAPADSSRSVGPDAVLAAVVLCAIVGLALVAGLVPAIDNVGQSDGWAVDTSGDGPADERGQPSGEDETGESGADEAGSDGSGEDSAGSDSDGESQDDPERVPDPTISVSNAAPGAEATIAVERGDEPVEGARVAVDGESIGDTDQAGRVRYDVPYEDAFEVTATAGADEAATTVDLATDAEIDPQYVDADGTDVVHVVATLDGNALPNASVLVDGERVGATDENGTASVPLRGEEMAVGVERGAASGETDVDGADVAVEVDRWYGLFALSGGPGEASVTVDGVPVNGAPLYVDGEEAGVTDESGETSFRYPLSDEATISTSVGGRTGETAVEGLAFRLAYLVLGVLSVGLGIVITYLRLFSLPERRRHRRIAWNFTFGLNWGRLAGAVALPLRIGRVGRSLPVRPALGDLVGSLRWMSQFGSALRLPRFSLSLSAPSLSGLSLLPSLDRGGRTIEKDDGAADGNEDEADGEDAEDDSDGDGADAEGDAADDPLSVQDAWHELVDLVDVYRRETTTPGRVARKAIDAGYPESAVRRLTATFRDVEYGGRAQTDERVRAANDAIDRIRSSTGDER